MNMRENGNIADKRCPWCGFLVGDRSYCHHCGKTVHDVEPIVKLRRRVEDVLRKSSPERIQQVAQFMGVK